MKLEAEVRFDAEKNEARLWLNGEMMLLGGVDDVGRMSRVIELVKRRTLEQVAWDEEYGE